MKVDHGFYRNIPTFPLGLGSAPLISVEDYQDGGIRVVCRSAGWYPVPEVLWRHASGQQLPSLSETKSQKGDGLFETENSIIIKHHSNQNLSCCIRNNFINQTKESAVYISGQLPSRNKAKCRGKQSTTK